MNLKNALITVAVCFAMAACDNHDELQKTEPGYFKVSQVQTSSSNGREKTSVQTGPSTTFDLGAIRTSREFYFLLENGGDSPIVDIELSVDNAAVSVSPRKITTLANSETSNVIPLINIGFTHGSRLNGVGNTSVLPKGTNSTILTITGKTLVNGDTTALQTQIALSVLAELMDIQLLNGQIEIPLPLTGDFGDGAPIRGTSASTVSLVNSGNVDILVHIDRRTYSVNDPPGYPKDLVMTPGQIEILTFIPWVWVDPDEHSHGGTLDQYKITLDGNGTVVNHDRIITDQNGVGHLWVINQDF